MDRNEYSPEFLSTRRQAAATIAGQLERYWASLGRDNGLPRRDLIDASEIGAALPRTFVAEMVAPGLCRFRVAGRAIAGFAGMEPRGLPLSSLFSANSREMLQTYVSHCTQSPAVVSLPICYKNGLFQGRSFGTLILLPLIDHDGHVTRILGGFDITESTGVKPAVFDIDDGGHIRCDRITPQKERPAHRPALRLVVNNG